MDKILELEDRFPTGEPTIQVLGHWGHSRWHLEKTALDKSAASPAYDYLKAYQAKPGFTIVLVNALGAFETYDENRNGDGFPERAYKVGTTTPCGHPECNPDGGRIGWIREPETLLHHYRSFEEHGGIYQHHVNKDSKKSLGKILRAIWNTRMHRVELILEIKNDRSSELIERINSGEYPAVSMGCHVKWDVCTICGHRAPTRAQYCEHARYAMRAIDSKTGKKNAVLNPSPRFFDISIVYRPADPQGYMLKKVAEVATLRSSAELGSRVQNIYSKQADAKKFSDIQKAISGQTLRVSQPEVEATKKIVPILRDIVRQGPSLTAKEARIFTSYPLPVIVSTLALKQAALSIGELVRITAAKGKTPWLHDFTDKIAALQPAIFEVFAAYPSLEEKLSYLVEIQPKHYSAKLAAELGDWLQQRALSPGGPLGGTPLGTHYQHYEPAKSDVMTLTDPNTGQVYKTTRGSAMASNESDQKAILGGTALLGGLYAAGLHKVTRGKLPWQANALLSLPAAFASSKALNTGLLNHYRNPTYVTDQGIPVSGGTEFLKSSTVLAKLACDYLERGVIDQPSLLNKIANNQKRNGDFIYILERLSDSDKVAYLTKDCVNSLPDAISEPTLDVTRFTLNLGQLLSR